MLEIIHRVSRVLSRVSLWVSAAGLTLMTFIIGWQVFARYVLNNSPSWSEQASLFLMLWFILFAAAVGVREGFHIRLTLLQDNLPAPARRTVRAVCHVIVGIFGGFMAWSGVDLAIQTWSHVIPTLGLSRGLAYVPMAGAGMLIVLFSVEHLLTEAHGEKVEPLWN